MELPAAVEVVVPALTACGGLAAAIFGALRYNRDDATAVVNQQKEVLASMKSLNDDLQQALDRTRLELRASEDELAAVKLRLALERHA